MCGCCERVNEIKRDGKNVRRWHYPYIVSPEREMVKRDETAIDYARKIKDSKEFQLSKIFTTCTGICI